MKKLKIKSKLIEIKGQNTGAMKPEQERLFTHCIGKYYTAKMNEYVRKEKIQDLDIDASFDMMLSLFADGTLKANIEDENNFVVFLTQNNDNIILYQMRDGKRL